MNEGQAASMSIWLFMDYRLYVGCLFVLEAIHGVSKKKKKGATSHWLVLLYSVHKVRRGSIRSNIPILHIIPCVYVLT